MIFSESSNGIIFQSDSFLCFFGKREANLNALSEDYPFLKFKRIKQAHGDVCVRTQSVDEDFSYSADAHWTTEDELGLVIATADCIPVMIYSSNPRMICAIHAGWRGVANRIIPKSIHELVNRGVKIENLSILIGPHIQYPSFEVGEDVKNQLLRSHLELGAEDINRKSGPFWKPSREEGKFLVDLHSLAEEQIREFQIPPDQIQSYFSDTMTDARFHSHRRDKEKAGRQLSFIALTRNRR